jgi:hypothetical protein
MDTGTMLPAIFSIIMVAFFGIFALLCLILWIWMLIDCITKETDVGNNRLIWVLVIVFTGAIGATIYYFVRKRKRI